MASARRIAVLALGLALLQVAIAQAALAEGAAFGPGEGSDCALTFTILPTDGTPFWFTRKSM